MRVKLNGKTEEFKAVWFENCIIKLIDQRALPKKFKIFNCRNFKDVAFAIKNMVVRGAPSIGCSVVYGIAQAFLQNENIEKASKILKNTRFTAHDLFYGIEYMKKAIENKEDIVKSAEDYVNKIINECKKIGFYGNRLIKNNAKILTHCNAGALATVDIGTALSPLRVAKENRKEFFVFVDETRPRLQGAKLTSWELMNEEIEHCIITDSSAGYLMKKGEIDLVLVGADRICRNGDFANKIGTYSLAVLSKENKIPFYVCAPSSTFDFNLKNGKEIKIEERDEKEVLFVGKERISPKKAKARNLAFDITDAEYVSGYITEKGILGKEEINLLKNL